MEADYADFPEYHEPLINEGARRIPKEGSKILEGILESAKGNYLGKDGEIYKERRAQGDSRSLSLDVKQRIADIVTDRRDPGENEHYFSIDALPYFIEHSRELLVHGWVPTIRNNAFDIYGSPVYPLDPLFNNESLDKKEEIPQYPEGAFIALVKCPPGFEAADFIKPLNRETVMENAEAGTLGFTDKFSHTTHITVASLTSDPETNREGKWSHSVVIPNVKYACEPLEQIKQYGTGIFEGIGVEMTEDGEAVVFRLDEHAKRIYHGANFYDILPRLKDPAVEEQRFEKFKELFTRMVIDTIRANWQYIPPHGKGRLYIRPNFFDHNPKMHADNSGRFLMLVTAIPIGSAESYFNKGEKTFFLARGRARVAEGCIEGESKAIAHYGKVTALLHSANSKGMAGVIFTNSAGDKIAETHASSLLVIIKYKDGSRKIITPQLDGTILDSITRKSCLSLAAQELGWKTEEKTITVNELKQLATAAASEKREEAAELENIEGIEVLAAGTGAALTPIHQIQIGTTDSKTDEIEEENYEELLVFDRAHSGLIGEAGKELFNLLLKAKSGKLPQEMRMEMMEGDEKTDSVKTAHRQQYESWLTKIPSPEEIAIT